MKDKDRLLKVISYSGLSTAKFARRIGFNRPDALYAILSERENYGISKEMVVAVVTTFPEISAGWLLMGQGVMRADNTNPPEPYSKDDVMELIDTVQNLVAEVKKKQL